MSSSPLPCSCKGGGGDSRFESGVHHGLRTPWPRKGGEGDSMGFTVNGIGTAAVPAGRLSKSGDFDAIECFVVAFLPVIPIKPLHTFNWSGNRYQAIPIRWSLELLARAFLGRWLWVPLIIGIGLLLIGFTDPPASVSASTNRLAGGAIVAHSAAGLVGLHLSYRRPQQIRILLGPHKWGSSDPATWEEVRGQSITMPYEAQGIQDSVAARELITKGRFSEAMWAARLAVLREGVTIGEELTDAILRSSNSPRPGIVTPPPPTHPRPASESAADPPPPTASSPWAPAPAPRPPESANSAPARPARHPQAHTARGSAAR